MFLTSFSVHSPIEHEYLNKSNLPIDGILMGTTTPDQSGPGGNGNEKGLHIQISITGASPSDAV